MAGGSAYERIEIESLLHGTSPGAAPEAALVLLPDAEPFLEVWRAAIVPALQENAFPFAARVPVFDAGATLDVVHRHLLAAEVIVADVTGLNPAVLYLLGLCHGRGRCPLLIGPREMDLPFNLRSLRHVGYEHDAQGLRRLRQDLGRALRVFLMASRAQYPPGEGSA